MRETSRLFLGCTCSGDPRHSSYWGQVPQGTGGRRAREQQGHLAAGALAAAKYDKPGT